MIMAGDLSWVENHTGNTIDFDVNREILPWCNAEKTITLVELRKGIYFGSAMSCHKTLVKEASKIGEAGLNPMGNKEATDVILQLLENVDQPKRITDPLQDSPTIYYNETGKVRTFVVRLDLIGSTAFVVVAKCLKSREDNVMSIISSRRK